MFHRTTRVSAAAALTLLLGACGGSPDYQTLDGSQGRFSDLRGRWFLINYWAEWCKPCIKELPELNEFQHQFATQATVFVVNYDGVAGDELVAQVERLGIEVPALVNDPSATLGYERPKALPSTLVFDPEGRLRTVLQGPQTVAELAKAIAAETQ